MHRALRFAATLAAGLAFATAASAATFDFIHVDEMNVALCPNGCGITLAGIDFGLIVNKQATDITGAQMYATQFTATSSSPDVSLFPFVNNPGGTDPTPIHPNEAVGSVGIGPPNNQLLLPLVHAPETFRNSAPSQFLAFQVNHDGPFVGDVTFNVTMTVGGDVAKFPILAHVTNGDFAISFVHASRVSSVPLATPAVATSWGKLKTLYR